MLLCVDFESISKATAETTSEATSEAAPSKDQALLKAVREHWHVEAFVNFLWSLAVIHLFQIIRRVTGLLELGSVLAFLLLQSCLFRSHLFALSLLLRFGFFECCRDRHVMRLLLLAILILAWGRWRLSRFLQMLLQVLIQRLDVLLLITRLKFVFRKRWSDACLVIPRLKHLVSIGFLKGQKV